MRTLITAVIGTLLSVAGQPLLGQDTSQDSIPARPTLTPFTEPPGIEDQSEALRIVDRYYPADLKDAGIGGTVLLWIHVDADGQVRNALVDWSSGNKQLDEAAIAAAREIRFVPARNLKQPVPVWIQRAITFRIDVLRPSDVAFERTAELVPLTEVVTAATPRFSCDAPIGVYWHRIAAAAPVEESLAGDYALTVVATAGFQNDTIAYGALWLRPTDADFRQAPNPDVTYPLYGASDIDLTSLGPVSLAYSPASRNQDNPGVYADYYSAGPSLDLVFGASPVTFDAGVIFDVFSIDSLGFTGRWIDGGQWQVIDANGLIGYPSPRPEGYFCARRLTVQR